MNHPCRPKSHVQRQQDRRRRRLPSLQALLFHPRRQGVRRDSDRRRVILLDWYPEKLFATASLVLVLSATDALLTLYLLNHGAYEVNPVMAYFLEKGSMTFWMVKYMLTAFSVTLLVIVSDVFIRFVRMYTRDLLKLFAGMYAAVIAWQLFLAFRYVL